MTSHCCTNRWVIATLEAVCSEVVDIVTLIREQFNEVLLEGVASVVGSDCDARHVFHSSRGDLLDT
jgi:hypothetical protein